MSARYPYYLLADSPEGRAKEQEITGRVQPDTPTHKDIRQGFVYERVPHITLKSIANNAEIDVIWETWQRKLEPLREALNARLKRNEPWEEWQIPREPGDPWPEAAIKQHAIAIDKDANEKRRLAALAKINKELGRKYTLETLPEKAVRSLDRRRGDPAACRLVGGAHRAAEGDRRLDRAGGRCRISL